MSQIAFTTPPLIGRDEELARLTGVLEHARDGEARAVLVAGDAGVGKTRLLDEVAGRAARAGTTVLTGHCVDLGDVGLPYLPFTEVLGTLAADERFEAALRAHPVVNRLLGAGTDAERDADGRLRLFEDVAGLLADLAATAPLLLVLEDLHWADQSSRDLLRFLLSRGVLHRTGGGVKDRRLTVLVSYRADDLHRRHPLRPLLAELVRLPAVERLELRPLPDPELARLVRALGDGPLPESVVRGIVDRAEGNAFYAEELLAAAGTTTTGMPSGLADLLLIRVEQLSETAQLVLRTAAVAGRRVEHALLLDAAGLPDDELETALREAVGRQLLVPGDDGAYAFRHALTREAVYADLLPGERSRLHGAYARLLAACGRAPETAAERAHHHRESHNLPEALAARLEAADHARRLGAPAEELQHLETALDLWSSVPSPARPAVGGLDRVTLTLRASAAAAHAGDAHRAVTLTRAALADVDQDADSELAARVRYTLAGNLLTVDSLTAAYRYSSEALAMIPADPPSQTWVWAAATHVAVARQVGEDETALRVARQALRVAEELGVTAARADLLISLANVEGGGRKTAEGRERLGQARELARAAGNAPVELRALFSLAVAAFESGNLQECPALLADGLDRARCSGLLSSPYPLEMRYLQLLVMYTLGHWDDCVRTAAKAAAALPPVGGSFATSPALYVALARGEQSVLARARALLTGPFDWMGRLVAGVVLTDAAAQESDPEGAIQRMRTVIAELGDGTTRRPGIAIRLAALCLGAVADRAVELRRTDAGADLARWAGTATELVELARATAGQDGAGHAPGPEGQAWLARAEAEWTDVVSGADPAAWEKAVAAYWYGDGYEQARCRLRYAQALIAVERRAEAAEQALLARETAAGLGAAPLLDRVDVLIRRGRLTAVPSGTDRSAPLTARERDVLRLLARGRTNRQIGEELFISGKTASVHVSNILAKLHATSRTEAVAIAYREGLIAPDPMGSG
ncbi:helix-turn-helix transcriptional regulator [Streptomyces pluripotens]|uniref:Helix-turn-helix transcriptional regulator n=1 Tax=Streptomyces pluripotens TaxID=1355015 RepID=A0A221P6M7_9ACTN|nr:MULTISPECIES: helix-turn-helix transcriptional regulator [Streptomyces]ARP73618.1 LuxR family transcriptional regulator [Streptomyces pluripotens]ASN27867.1 helix-turn-helix transcriptional regulator [Streptomyces pluripotens]KIE23088.1 LuxR family transcriptional regulator [Streptomyces sp. MUSC 125]